MIDIYIYFFSRAKLQVKWTGHGWRLVVTEVEQPPLHVLLCALHSQKKGLYLYCGCIFCRLSLPFVNIIRAMPHMQKVLSFCLHCFLYFLQIFQRYLLQRAIHLKPQNHVNPAIRTLYLLASISLDGGEPLLTLLYQHFVSTYRKHDIKNSGCVKMLWAYSLSRDVQQIFLLFSSKYKATTAVPVLFMTVPYAL